MRRLFLLTIITVIAGSALLVSCTNGFDDWHYTIENKTEKDISFTFNAESVTLEAGASKSATINSKEGRMIPRNFDFSGHPESIRMETRGLTYVFMLIEPVKLIVENKVPRELTIKAGNFLAGPTKDDPISLLTIPGEHKIETGLYIYTLQPRFSIEPSVLPGSGTPIIATWDTGEVRASVPPPGSIIPIIPMWDTRKETDGTKTMTLTLFAASYGYEG